MNSATLLPVCRHRGAEVSSGEFRCHHPRLMNSTGTVRASVCRECHAGGIFCDQSLDGPPRAAELPDLRCLHRGELLRTEECKPCQGTRQAEIRACRVYGECTVLSHALRRADGAAIATCIACADRQSALPRRLILRSGLALGDIVCLTAAVRELHRQHPGEFVTDVRTPFPAVWEHNPDVTSFADDDPQATLLDLHYDRHPYVSVHRSNQHPVHLIEGYCQDLSDQLGLPPLRPQELRGHIHLSAAERGWMSLPHEKHNVQKYWVLCLGGGKRDFTTKWWVPEYVQQVVDHFRGRLQFVQIGSANDHGHWHPDLRGAIDLRGQTDLRQLIRIIHSAVGVVSGVTAAMHLAAAVPTPAWQSRPRPCVVVAGGREPRTWYGYPTHRILENVGSLPCCATGGCWHGRTVPLHDGKDERLCERVIEGHPKCMWMIRPRQVIDAIESYLEGAD